MSVSRIDWAALAMIALSPLPSKAATPGGAVRVDISGLRNTSGDIRCLMFNGPDGFPELQAKAFRTTRGVIDGDHAVCDFRDVAPGNYAVIVLHDENSNGRMDRNLMGVPQEGYVASNNLHPAMSAPGFRQATFTVGATGVTSLSLRIRY